MFDVDWEWNPDTSGEFGGARDEEALTMQAALAKQTGCLTQDGINNGGNKDQDRQNCQKLNAASATIDLGLMKFKPGEYKYMSSRNNNFSNRAQKATITATDLTSVPPDAAENVKVEQINSGKKKHACTICNLWPVAACNPACSPACNRMYSRQGGAQGRQHHGGGHPQRHPRRAEERQGRDRGVG